jgi:hypothetical protein
LQTFQNEKEFLKDNINELGMNSKNIRNLYTGINNCKKCYQPRSNLVKDKNGDLLADSHILNWWMNYFSQLLNVHWVSDVWQIEIQTDLLLVPDPSPFENETSIGMCKRYKVPCSDRIQAGGETLQSEIHKLINPIWNKEELPDQWKECIIVPICQKGYKTDCNTY